LRRLIEAKRAGDAPLGPAMIRRGFRGWHERGYLPHYDAPHITQIATFMLADSFPVERRAEWEPILEEADESLRRRKLEAWLDRGMGECWLRQARVAALVEEKLRRFDGVQCRLQAWLLMPNHVHLVVDVGDTPLSQLLKHWKGGTAREAKLVLGRRRAFWQEDYFDTKIRDAAHLAQAIRCVELNPTKAKLVREPREWPWSSARLRDDYNRLPWQRDPESTV
jgi:REP element-mobilizing transposase RayT